MRIASIIVHQTEAGKLIEKDNDEGYIVQYDLNYQGDPISLTMPVRTDPYIFKKFPAFFDGVLPEGPQLEALLRYAKLDRYDYFGQLITVGSDLVGAVSVKPCNPEKEDNH